ncbi:MAG: hypothetical protein MJ180_00095 [Candidatus Gastranaerophilales bacterium]|nr:hypothetical protein [Candidatus Gastranaerophilales bacterium]
MELEIKKSPTNRGLCCYFEYKNKKYYADLCELPSYHTIFTCLSICTAQATSGTECMIFEIKNGEIDFSEDLYCRTGIEVTQENIKECIEDFIKSLESEE